MPINLTRDAIANMRDFKIIPIEVPEWHGTIYLREMNVGAQDALRQLLFKYITDSDTDTEEALITRRVMMEHPELILEEQILTLQACLCDADGQLLFNDPEGRSILRQRSIVVIERLYRAAKELNGQDVEQEKKDLNGMPSTASNSSSVATLAGVLPNSGGV